ncbi:hypothetical protein CPC08DRAFT_712044 [Agrocybe pediades]|nr:hypothetical protein CPC08DRAFT_712044 [Agrocybe pediades]
MPGQLKGTITGKNTSLNGLFKDSDAGQDCELIGKFDESPPKDIGEVDALLKDYGTIPEGRCEFSGTIGPTQFSLNFYRLEDGSVAATVTGNLSDEIEPYDVNGTATWQVKLED